MSKQRYRPLKVFLPRCRALREAAALQIGALAAAAGVDRGLITSLEGGSAHTVAKVRAVFNTLNQIQPTPLDPEVELVPLRFMPNCRTLRERCKLTIAALAGQAGVDRGVVDAFEKHHGGTLADAQALLAVLANCLAARHEPPPDPAVEIDIAPP